jgi:hypothetical protein
MTRRSLLNSMMLLAAAGGLMVLAVVLAPQISSAGGKPGESGRPNPADFSTDIDNPLFPLSSLGPKVFTGLEASDNGEVTARLESEVLPNTITVAGVEVLVLEERAFEGGELVEVALDFFAQHSDGTVWYFGERVDNYENGKFVDHEGTWLAGRSGNEPGIIMLANPVVGQEYDQENAPGVAEDHAKVLSTNDSVSTPAGNFTGCLKTEETTPLEPDVKDFKWYCPNVGLVRDESLDGGFIELETYTIVGSSHSDLDD